MKDGHAPDHGLVKSMMTSTEPPYEHSPCPATVVGNGLVVFGVRQEMHLMDVHGVQFLRSLTILQC